MTVITPILLLATLVLVAVLALVVGFDSRDGADSDTQEVWFGHRS